VIDPAITAALPPISQFLSILQMILTSGRTVFWTLFMTWFLNLMVLLPSGHQDAFLSTLFPHILLKLQAYETSQHNVICQVSFCGKFCKNLGSKNVLLSDI
jgi:hypothetical protein